MDYAAPKVNIRSKFDFDSDVPVPAEIHKPDSESIYDVIDLALTSDVILAGVWLGKWWYDGGWVWMRYAFAHWAPWVLRMAESGQL